MAPTENAIDSSSESSSSQPRPIFHHRITWRVQDRHLHEFRRSANEGSSTAAATTHDDGHDTTIAADNESMGESTVASEGPELRREELHIADRQAYLEAGLINDNGGSMRRAGGCGLGALVCGWYKKIRMLARCAVSSAT